MGFLVLAGVPERSVFSAEEIFEGKTERQALLDSLAREAREPGGLLSSQGAAWRRCSSAFSLSPLAS